MARPCAGRLELRRRPWAAALVLLLGAAAAASASAQIATDGTMHAGPPQVLSGSDVTIPAGLGTATGGNLFHSFSDFNIATGGSATFDGPGAFANVISRVTGGSMSNIDGLLKSNIGTSGFFFINPAGVAFGPGASIDVPGAFHVSTADQIRFPGGGVFDASTPANTVLSVADPSAFGFLAANPASISATGATLEVAAGQTLSLVGGDLTIDGGLLEAQSGVINLASVASAGEVSLASGVPALTGFGVLGPVAMSNEATVTTRGDPGGTIHIRAGQLVIDNGASDFNVTAINSGTTGAADGAPVGVDIQVAGDVILDRTEIASSSFGTGASGRVDIVAGGRVVLVGDPSPGNVFGFGSNIASRVFGSGMSGGINIVSGGLEMGAHGLIDSQVTFFGTGESGDIFIDTGNLILDGSERQAFIATFSFGGGVAGSLTILADTATLRGGSAGFTGITTQVGAQSQSIEDAGDLTVIVGRLEVLDGAELSASIFNAPGSAGNINILADSILVSGISSTGFSAGIFANSFGGEFSSGNAGTITIETGSLTVQERGQVSTFSNSLGNSGKIDIVADTVRVDSGGLIGASNFGFGTAGPLTIQAGSIELVGPTPAELFDFPALDLIPFTGIASISGDTGTGGGTITVGADQLTILDGAQINALTTGPGTGGRIVVTANNLQASGVDQINALKSGIVSDSTSLLANAGAAGSIDISAIDLRLDNGAEITASTQGPGAGGSIALRVANAVALDGAGTGVRTESTSAAPGAGTAGNIVLVADALQMTGGAEISTRSARADGGNIEIGLASRLLLRDSRISTSVGTGEGAGGNITIGPVFFVILDKGTIQANAFGGPGGNILIVANNFIATPDSIVEASSQLGINGTVRIESPDTDVATGVVVLSESLMDAAARLAQQCGARGGRTLASFVGVGRGGLPVQPGAATPSHYLAAAGSKLSSAGPDAARQLAALSAGTVFVPASLQLECSV